MGRVEQEKRDRISAALQRATGGLSTAATAAMSTRMSWWDDLSAEDRSWVGVIVQAGVKGFVDWYGDTGGGSSATLSASVFGAAPARADRRHHPPADRRPGPPDHRGGRGQHRRHPRARRRAVGARGGAALRPRGRLRHRRGLRPRRRGARRLGRPPRGAGRRRRAALRGRRDGALARQRPRLGRARRRGRRAGPGPGAAHRDRRLRGGTPHGPGLRHGRPVRHPGRAPRGDPRRGG